MMQSCCNWILELDMPKAQTVFYFFFSDLDRGRGEEEEAVRTSVQVYVFHSYFVNLNGFPNCCRYFKFPYYFNHTQQVTFNLFRHCGRVFLYN